jgi:integration host factor subunit alpha
MTVTKAEMAYFLMDEMRLTRLTSLELVNSLFDTIRETLASGEDVRLSGFGNFTLREKAARTGRNPKNGEPHVITARRVVLFKASRKVKERDSNPVAG